jgi:hypothetical protein
MQCIEASPDNCGVGPKGPTWKAYKSKVKRGTNLKKFIFLAKFLYCRCINDLLFSTSGHLDLIKACTKPKPEKEGLKSPTENSSPVIMSFILFL